MGRTIMFMVFVWLIVSIGGGIAQGSTVIVTTKLTADVTATEEDSISVTATEGFPDTGTIVIDDEHIGYATKTATTFNRTSVLGVTVSPMRRGEDGTIAGAHTTGKKVRTLESSMLNSSMGYKMAVMTDSAGLIAFVTVPFAFITLLVSFLTLPLAFLGTDLAILTYLWAVVSIGLIVTIAISVAGGRRV